MTYNSANRITNNLYPYDASGDVIYDGANWYAYDNEGRLCAVQANITGAMVATGYLYDAEGRRVAKGSITTSTTAGNHPCQDLAAQKVSIATEVRSCLPRFLLRHKQTRLRRRPNNNIQHQLLPALRK